jgi:NADPH-dependent glutamate synthase beta subunit-like oxidoreductase
MKYGKAILLSMFIVGGGQIYSGRYIIGIVLAAIFYGTIAVMINTWAGINPAFWGLVGAWFLVWLYNIYDAYKGYQYEQPPCEKACPALIAPWVYINLIATDNKQQIPFVPFFYVLELICPAPCEARCTRQGIDASVAIKYLKSGVATVLPTAQKITHKEKIAVIGAGPCGLSAAYYLATRGYKVVVYEREEKAGGVLGTLIPEFRLPQSALDKEINIIKNAGVNIKYGVEIGEDLSISTLLNEYDVILVAAGAWKPTKLYIPGEENALVSFDVLRRIKQGEKLNLGKVCVIGGGNTAIDIARSLLRQGHDVEVYYRRKIDDMPATYEDRTEAEEEGVEIIPLAMPIRIEKNRVIMVKTECAGGRKGIVRPVEGSEYDIIVDNIVIAIGQQPDIGFLNNHVKKDRLGRINAKNGRTSHPKIFAGGDVVLGSATVAHAVGQGLTIAEQIDFYLRGINPVLAKILKKTHLPDVQLLPRKDIERIKIPHRDVKERIHDFKPVELKVSKDLLKKEASRCLTCPLRYRP